MCIRDRFNDLSNSYIGITGYTKPSDFGVNDISQNFTNSTTTTVQVKINNSQISGSLDISGYDIDISSGSGWVTNRDFDEATSTGATDDNTVSIGSLSANTLYDLSINMWNKHDLSNNKSGLQIHTDPANFGATYISQVLHTSGPDFAATNTASI